MNVSSSVTTRRWSTCISSVYLYLTYRADLQFNEDLFVTPPSPWSWPHLTSVHGPRYPNSKTCSSSTRRMISNRRLILLSYTDFFPTLDWHILEQTLSQLIRPSLICKGHIHSGHCLDGAINYTWFINLTVMNKGSTLQLYFIRWRRCVYELAADSLHVSLSIIWHNRACYSSVPNSP